MFLRASARSIYLSAIIISCLSLVSCQSTPKKSSAQVITKNQLEKPTTSTQQEYHAAKKLYDAKDFKKALPKLKKFVQQYPNSELTPNAYSMIGQIYNDSQDQQNAFHFYKLAARNDSPNSTEASLRAAKIGIKLAHYDESQALLESFNQRSSVSRETQTQVQQLQYDLYIKEGRIFDAFMFLETSLEHETDPKQIDLKSKQALDLIENQMSMDDTYKVADQSKQKTFVLAAKFKLGSSFFEQANYGRAKYFLGDVQSAGKDTPYFDRADSMMNMLNSRDKVDSRTIGLIVPLTGKRSVVGYKTLRGVQLGLGIYGNKASSFRLVVMDSELNPDVARKAVEKLVLEDNVIAIIGGVESKTVNAEAAKAQEYGVPFIALSQKSGVTQIGENIFRNALTGSMIVDKIVDTAMNDLRLTKFAILFPNDAYGVEYANLFWDRVKAAGGSITAAQVYNPKETDFSGYIQRMVNTFYIEDRAEEFQARLKALEEAKDTKKVRHADALTPDKVLPPIVDFQAIFIPDGTAAFSSIASYLSYYDVDNVYLLGTNIWNNPSILAKPELKRSLEKSLFVDSFLSTDNKFLTSDFYSNFKNIFNEEPGIFEVQAYDSALIVRQALNTGADNRLQMSNKLLNIKSIPGALGNLSISKDREVSRPLISIKIQKDQFTQFR